MSSTPILQRLTLVAALVLAGCSSKKTPEAPVRQPEDVKAQIQRLLPSHVSNKAAWSDDIYTTFRIQQIDPSASNLCAVIAVADQESNFSAEAAVPGLPKSPGARSIAVRRRCTSRHSWCVPRCRSNRPPVKATPPGWTKCAVRKS